MPSKDSFEDWKEYYEDQHFWDKVRHIRLFLPHPDYYHDDTYIVKLKTGLMLKFRKFYFTTRDGRSLFGQSTIDRIWMFDTICDPNQYWKSNLDFKN